MKKMTEKQKETLTRMKETRKADYTFIREIAKDKLKWAKSEKEKGIKFIASLKQKQQETEDTLKRLEGAIVVLEELLEAKSEKQEKSDITEEKING